MSAERVRRPVGASRWILKHARVHRILEASEPKGARLAAFQGLSTSNMEENPIWAW